MLILLAVALYGVVHSLLASLGAKAQARRWFGGSAARSYRLVFNLFGVISFLPVIALVAALPDTPLYSVPLPLSVVMMAGQGLAVVMLLVGVLQTDVWAFAGLRQLVSPAGEEKASLVVTGLYSHVRHPLYTAGLVFMWLSPVMTVNLLALYAGLTFYLIIGAYFEERKLLQEFGEAYADYRRRTPMLIPGLRFVKR